MADVVAYSEAVQMVREKCAEVTSPRTERVRLEVAAGRVLAEAVMADRDQPPFPRSTRDGYAVSASALSRGGVRVVGEVRAGDAWAGAAINEEQAVEIMTGAPVPKGSDAVVMLEHVERDGDVVRLLEGKVISAGDNVVALGSEVRAGVEVVSSGKRLGPAQIGVAAACGAAGLDVYARPLVAILSTGDELVGVAERPQQHQIRNSNAHALAAAVEQAGGEARVQPVARDAAASLREVISGALPCDLLLLTGGVSAGKYDLVEPVLEREFGCKFFFSGVRMQPGRPVAFGQLENGTFVFGLPGNPVSALVTFAVLARPLLLALSGESDGKNVFSAAQLREDVELPAGLVRFLPATVRWEGGVAGVRRAKWQGSGDIAAAAGTNCFLVVPETGGPMRAGDWVQVLVAF